MCEYRHYINTEGRGQSANTYFKNNSSKIFSCIRTHANTGPTCIRAKINSSRNIFPAFRRAERGPASQGAGVANCRIFLVLLCLPLLCGLFSLFPWGEEKVMTIYDAGRRGPPCRRPPLRNFFLHVSVFLCRGVCTLLMNLDFPVSPRKANLPRTLGRRCLRQGVSDTPPPKFKG